MLTGRGSGFFPPDFVEEIGSKFIVRNRGPVIIELT